MKKFNIFHLVGFIVGAYLLAEFWQFFILVLTISSVITIVLSI